MPGDKRLRNLAVAQLVIGAVAAMLALVKLPDPYGLASLLPPFGLERILIVPLFASALCQAVLLALWAVSSTASPWRRMVGLVAGAAYLDALLAIGTGGEFLGTATVTIAATTATLLGLWAAMGIGLAPRGVIEPVARPEPEGLRFSIRGLMAFTAAVALLSAGARALQGHPGRFFLQAAIWGLCFVAVGLVALWAALGEASPKWRWPIVLALSPVLGGFFAHAVSAHHAGWLYIILTMLIYSAGLIGSLLVVRRCGHRLVGRSAPHHGG